MLRILLSGLLCLGAAGALPAQTAGRTLFESQCARCHGLDGRGGQGPSLRRPVLARAADDSSLVQFLLVGAPERGMPAVWQLSPDELRTLAAYVRSLGRLPTEPVPGDPQRGAAYARGNGGCLACHVVRGEGGVLGPDLSGIGLARGPAHLRRALLAPDADLPSASTAPYGYGERTAYLPVQVQLNDGRTVTGVRVLEDAFVVLVRDLAGRTWSLDRTEIRRLEVRRGESLMPSYAGRLSPAEVDDVVAWLTTLQEAR